MDRKERVFYNFLITGFLFGFFFPLQVLASELVWAPAGDTAADWTWDAGITAAWMNGSARTTFTNADDVTFNSSEDNVYGPRIIAISGTQSPSTVLFSGDKGYTLTGGTLEITTGLTLSSTGEIKFDMPVSIPKTTLSSGTFIFSTPFNAGSFVASDGATIKAAGSGEASFTFSAGEGETKEIQSAWDKGDCSRISVHKTGTGTTTLNLAKLDSALDSQAHIYVDEGTLIGTGYKWYAHSVNPLFFEVASNAVLSSTGEHAMGDYGSKLQVHLHRGGMLKLGGENYFSNADPGLWLSGNTKALGELRNKSSFFIKTEGKNNFVEKLYRGMGTTMSISVLDDGELYVQTLQTGNQTITKTGTGTLFVDIFSAANESKPVRIESGSMIATNRFTVLQTVPIVVSDGASFENHTSEILWLQNTASSSTGSGAFHGKFGVKTSQQNFSNQLTIDGAFYIREDGFDADFTGLTVKGSIAIDHGLAKPFVIPSTLTLSENTVAEVVAGAESPANLSGTQFSIPLHFAPDSHAYIPIGEGKAPVHVEQGITFGSGSVVHIALDEGTFSEGTYPIFDGISTIPTTLPQIQGHLPLIQNAKWVIQNNALAVKIHTTGSVETLTWRPQQTEGDYVWSPDVANWENEQGTKKNFQQGSSALFDGNEPNHQAKILVTNNVTPGDIYFTSTTKDFVLAGEKLQGHGVVSKEGNKLLVVDGGGFAAQQIQVKGGLLQLGENAATNALGSEFVPIQVSSNGTIDINYTLDDENNFSRNEITHSKIFQIEGEGIDGKGALVNNGQKQAFRAFSKIELTGDATVGGSARMDMRSLSQSASIQDRPLLIGPDKVLTVKNTGLFGLVGTDADLKKIVVTDNGVFRPEENTTLKVKEGIDLVRGTFNPYNPTVDFTIPLNAISGTNHIQNGAGTGKYRGPITVGKGATLELSGNKSQFYGSVTNNGTLRVTGGEQYFAGPVWSDQPFDLSGGKMFCGLGSSEWPTFGKSKEFNLNGGSLNFLPAELIEDEGFSIKGKSLVYFLAASAQGALKLKNTVINITDWMNISDPSHFGSLILGEGCDINVIGLQLGSTSYNPKSGLLCLLPGSQIVVSSGDTRIGHWSGSSLLYQHDLTIDGGTLINSNGMITVGWDSPHAALQMNDGLLDTRGIKLRRNFTYLSQVTCTEHFIMSGGLLKLGADGIITSRTSYPNDSGAYLNGGTITNIAPFGIAYLSRVAFTGDPVTWELGNNLVNFNAALQGDGEVTIRGNARFNNIDNGVIHLGGSVRGHWTIGNKEETCLKNAAVFTKGLTLEENAKATVDISDSSHVRLAILQGVKDVSAKDCNNRIKMIKDFPYLDYAMPYVHTTSYARDNTAYLYAGEFYVAADQAGTWTFAESFDDEVYLAIDSNTNVVLNDNAWDRKTTGQIQLEEGWHTFRLAVQQGGGGKGPVGSDWSNKNMGIGWATTPITSTSADSYTPFSPDKLPMRVTISQDIR